MGIYFGRGKCHNCGGVVATTFISAGEMAWYGQCENCGPVTPNDCSPENIDFRTTTEE
jgi:hypothetical protein